MTGEILSTGSSESTLNETQSEVAVDADASKHQIQTLLLPQDIPALDDAPQDTPALDDAPHIPALDYPCQPASALWFSTLERYMIGRPDGIESYERHVSKAPHIKVHVGSDIGKTAELQAVATLKNIQSKLKIKMPGEDVNMLFATGKTQWMGLMTLVDFLERWDNRDPSVERLFEEYEIDMSDKPDMSRIFASNLDTIFPQKRDAYFSYARELHCVFDRLGIEKSKRMMFYGDIKDPFPDSEQADAAILDANKNQMPDAEFGKLMASVNAEGIQVKSYLDGALGKSHPQYAYLMAMNRYAKAVSRKLMDRGGADIQLFSVGGSYDGKGHIGFNETGTPFDQGVRMMPLNYHAAAGNLMDNGGMSTLYNAERNERFAAVTLGPAEFRMNPEAATIMTITDKAKRESARLMIETEPTPLFPSTALQNSGEGSVLILDPSAAGALRHQTHPWDFVNIQSEEWDEALKSKLFIQVAKDRDLPVKEVTIDHFLNSAFGNVKEISDIRRLNLRSLERSPGWQGWQQENKAIHDKIRNSLMKSDEVLSRIGVPEPPSIVSIEPHSDDIGLAIPFLIQKWARAPGNNISAFIATSGYTAVGTPFILDMMATMESFSDDEVEVLVNESADPASLKTAEERYIREIIKEIEIRIQNKELHDDPADYRVWGKMSPAEQKLRAKLLFLRMNGYEKKEKPGLYGEMKKTKSGLYRALKSSKCIQAIAESLRLIHDHSPDFGAKQIDLLETSKTFVRFMEQQIHLMMRGVAYETIAFPLDSSWYAPEKVGTATKEDIDAVKKILQEKKPDMIIVNGEGFMDHGAHSITEATVKIAVAELIAESLPLNTVKIFTYRGVWDRTEVSGVGNQVLIPVTADELDELHNKFAGAYVSQSPAEAPDPSVDEPTFFSHRVAANAKTTYQEYKSLTGATPDLDGYEGVLAFDVIAGLEKADVFEKFKTEVYKLSKELKIVHPFIGRATMKTIQGKDPPYPVLSGDVGCRIVEVLNDAGIAVEKFFLQQPSKSIDEMKATGVGTHVAGRSHP